MKKKKNGWKTAFIVLLIAVLGIGALWMFGGDDEYEDYDRDSVNYGAVTESQNASSTSASVQTANTQGETIISSYDAVVRSPQSVIKGNGQDKITILVYMNGSDLESEDGEATEDLQEMIKAGGCDNVNILVQTMGTKSWSKTLGISSNRSQIWSINGDGFNLVKDDLGQLDCTVSSSLQSFITWGASNYPADRYFLIFWNHGGGPVYGFGYDEYQDEYDALTIDEIQTALKNSGVYFDFIGMDCCIMSSLEVCCAFYDYCDYCILSEDFESGYGWSYTPWLKQLYSNTSITVTELGQYIVDSMISANDSAGEDGILAVIDEGVMKVLYTAWVNFAYANEDTLLGTNYSQQRSRSVGDRVSPILLSKGFFSDWGFGSDSSDDDVSLSDYYITDLMATASNIDSDESSALSAAVAKALVYMKATSGDASLTGISITLPYGDSDFYSDLKTIFTNCGFESSYIEWLEGFVSASGSSSYYDYDDWSDEWSSSGGWDDYDDDYNWDDDDFSLWDILFGDWDDEDYDDMDSDYGWGWSDSDWGYEDSYNYSSDDYDEYGDWYSDWDYGYDDYYYYDDDNGYDYYEFDEGPGGPGGHGGFGW